jgi:hypothetical protein
MSREQELRNRTLEQLDGQVWSEPNFGSHVVTNCHRLRSVPLKDFTVEDLRLMIGQGLSLRYLVPLAIEHLEVDPFVEGDFYPGDLLQNVLRVPQDFWAEYPVLRRRITAVVADALAGVDAYDVIGEVRERLNDWPHASR